MRVLQVPGHLSHLINIIANCTAGRALPLRPVAFAAVCGHFHHDSVDE